MLPALLAPSLAQIGAMSAAGVGLAGAGAVGAGAVGAGGLAGAGALGGAGAAGGGASGGLMAGGMKGGGLMGGGMGAGRGVASQFAVPGAPGFAGGTPTMATPGAKAGVFGSGAPAGPKFDWMKMANSAGGGAHGGYEGIQPPQLSHGPMQPFTPFQFSRSNYQFRRGLGL